MTKQMAQVEELIAPSIEAMGYALVQVRMLGGEKRQTLQIMAERADGREMTVDDCAELSHAISALLDVEDPVPGAYNLEVSSPGIDRPLVRREDFVRYTGYEARLEASRLIDGRKRFRGRLLGVSGENVRIALDAETEAEVPLEAIGLAKLLLTDELIEAALKRRGT